MRLRALLPEQHLSDDSRHLLETGLGIIGTIGGLVLGLLVASAFGTYNAQRTSLIQLSSNVIVLDRVLAHYGREANGVRAALRGTVAQTIDAIWPPRGKTSNVDPSQSSGDKVFDTFEQLNPQTDRQRALKGIAVGLIIGLAQTRWLMYQQLQLGFSTPLLVVLIFWFTVTFIGLGIFTKANPTVVVALFLAAVAVSGALLLLQQMYTPFQGAMQISSEPLRQALAHLGK